MLFYFAVCCFCLVLLEAVLFCICCSMLLYVCLIPYVLLDVAVLLFCVNLLYVGHVVVFSDHVFYLALVCSMLLCFAKCC